MRPPERIRARINGDRRDLARCSASTAEADALTSMARMLAWRQHRRTGGHRLASRSHELDVRPIGERLRVLHAIGNGRDSRMCKSRGEGRDGDRARLACSESARHAVRCRRRTFGCDSGMLSTVPWGVVRSALHIGRCEGDAVGHQRSDRRIAPIRNDRQLGVPMSMRTAPQQASTRPSRKLPTTSCAQAPSMPEGRAERAVEAQRRALTAPSTAGRIEDVMAGPDSVVARQSAARIPQNRAMNGAKTVANASRIAATSQPTSASACRDHARAADRHPRATTSTPTGKPWRERPSRTGAGPPRARDAGVVHTTAR